MRRLLHKLLALSFGWRLAYDDVDGTLVVYHTGFQRHFTGHDAFRNAVRFSCKHER